jgi:hypothetical protein
MALIINKNQFIMAERFPSRKPREDLNQSANVPLKPFQEINSSVLSVTMACWSKSNDQLQVRATESIEDAIRDLLRIRNDDSPVNKRPFRASAPIQLFTEGARVPGYIPLSSLLLANERTPAPRSIYRFQRESY